MADSELVKYVMFPAVQLEKNATVGEALRKLTTQKALFGVVNDLIGNPLAIVTREHLSTAKPNEPVLMLSTSTPYPVLIEPYIPIDSIVQAYADDFKANQNFMGIVVQERGKVKGILLRETIEKLLLASRIPGTSGLKYRCKPCPGDPKCSGDSFYPPECPEDSDRPMEPADK